MAKTESLHNIKKQEMNKLFRTLPAEVRDHSRRIQVFSEIIFNCCFEAGVHPESTFYSKKSNSAMLKSVVKYHDIGKAKINKEAVTGFDGLAEDLWAKYKQHAAEGISAFESVVDISAFKGDELRYWTAAMECVAQHHERWDGTGYPEGLSGMDISPAAMICAVANNLDYLTTSSGMRDSLPFEAAVQKIKERSGTYFDPAVVEVVVSSADKLQATKEEMDKAGSAPGGHKSQRAIELLYKPVYDYNNRQTFGYSAVLRLNDKALNNLPYDAVAAIAAKSGRINELFKWSLTEACENIDYVEGRGRFMGVVFLPLSVTYLLKKNCVDNICRIIRNAGKTPDRFCLMLKENLLELDTKGVTEKVAELREKGFTVGLSGFGTEYANYATFEKLDVDYLELDGSFVEHMTMSDRAKKIADNIVEMAKRLDTYILAQGVSDKIQAKALFDMGCIYMQGDHFGKYQTMDLI